MVVEKSKYSKILTLIFFIFLTSCGVRYVDINTKEEELFTKNRFYKTLSKYDPNNFTYKGHYKIGRAYKIYGKKYTPRKVNYFVQEGFASWYGPNFHGKATANGDIYNQYMLSAAHPTLPLPSIIEVTNLENKNSLILLVNDRGPYKKNRILDVSESAAALLGFKKKGIAKVRVKFLKKETDDFLERIGLDKKEGSKARVKKDLNFTKNAKCSINCSIVLLNPHLIKELEKDHYYYR